MTATLSDRELATVLASLRAFQCMLPLKGTNSEWFLAVSADGGTLAPLSAGEVEDLILRLNYGPEPEPVPEAQPAPDPGDLTKLPAGELIARLARMVDQVPAHRFDSALWTEVSRRLKRRDEQTEEDRRRAVIAFVGTAAATVCRAWGSSGARPLIGGEYDEFAKLLYDFFKNVR